VIQEALFIPFGKNCFRNIFPTKLDEGQDVYVEKIKSLFEDAKINTLTVMIMQVPCCMGLVNLVRAALQKSKRKVPIKSIVVSIKGEILQEGWIST